MEKERGGEGDLAALSLKLVILYKYINLDSLTPVQVRSLSRVARARALYLLACSIR